MHPARGNSFTAVALTEDGFFFLLPRFSLAYQLGYLLSPFADAKIRRDDNWSAGTQTAVCNSRGSGSVLAEPFRCLCCGCLNATQTVNKRLLA